MSNTTSKEVLELLQQYEQYKAKLSALSDIERRLAKAKIINTDTSELSNEHNQLRNELQQISDDMTFDTPLIWMQYKYLAYQYDAQPIRTLGDFRVHCSKPGYICTKRFTFLNASLAEHEHPRLDDQDHYDDSMELSDLFHSESLANLEKDQLFMQTWRGYEYFKDEDRVAKWENYA